MSGGSDIPRTPNQERGEGSQKSNRPPDIPSGDFSPSKKQRPDDQTEINQPQVRICDLLLGPEEFGYTKRVLTPAEVDPTNPVLRISDDYEHSVFLHNHSLMENPDFAGSIPYTVYDKNMRQYNMSLSRTEVSLSEWATIVRDCGLRAGDRVWFCRYLDTRISDDFVYYFKNNDETLAESELDNISAAGASSTTNPVVRIVYRPLLLLKIPGQGPGSRDLPQGGQCISMRLNEYSVVWVMGKLFLSDTDAVILAGDPRIVQIPIDGKYEKDIQVFDGENRMYTMKVSAHYSHVQGVFYYCLGGEWNNFVRRHNLEQGDLLMIYKCLDSTFSPRYYHVLRYVSNKAAAKTQKMYIPDGPGSSNRCLP